MHTDKHAHQKQARRHAQKDNEMLALFAAQGIEAIARSARVYGAPVLPKLLCDATVPHPAARGSLVFAGRGGEEMPPSDLPRDDEALVRRAHLWPLRRGQDNDTPNAARRHRVPLAAVAPPHEELALLAHICEVPFVRLIPRMVDVHGAGLQA